MNSSGAAYWRGMASGRAGGVLNRLLMVLLLPASGVYAAILRIRGWLYGQHILGSRKLPRPVISIGNITVGGTGKTPATALLARMLMAQGQKVAVLSRGYGGSLEGTTAIVSDGERLLLSARECGDEPFLLASSVPGLMVVIGPDRHAAGMVAMEQLAPDIFLLDDGFQHLRLQRDLNILLLDCSRPFGNGWTLPAGLLREPIAAAARADLIIFTRCARGGEPPATGLSIPSCTARHELLDAVSLSGGAVYPFEALRGQRLMAFAGIAEPDSFFAALSAHGLNLVACRPLADHVVYEENVVEHLTTLLTESAADFAITTEKDAVKLSDLPQPLAGKILFTRLELVLNDPAPLTALLRNLLQK